MDPTPAEAIASYIPDWSQFATKDDRAKGMSQLRNDMSQMESRLVRWLVGIFLTFLALLGGLVTMILNPTGYRQGLA